VVGVGKSRRRDGEGAQYRERNVALEHAWGGVSMQRACGKWPWQGTTPQCEGFDQALATDMWWVLARAEEEMERAHNTESETWHRVHVWGACGVVMARRDNARALPCERTKGKGIRGAPRVKGFMAPPPQVGSIKWVRHQDFPGGHPSQDYSWPMGA